MRPTRRIQARTRQHRRTVNVRANPLMRTANGSEIKGHRSVFCRHGSRNSQAATKILREIKLK
jgi:hypothetical protein